MRGRIVPNVFLVGAPKCGTTTLYELLEPHPEVYCPIDKEIDYFGEDIPRPGPRLTYDAYLERFARGDGYRRVVDGTTSYLSSERAPHEILERSPEARILVMLRDPVQVAQALHGQRLVLGREDDPDFVAVMEAEAGGRRRRGVWSPPYREKVRFGEQLARYVNVFGEDRTHVIFLDDLRANPAETYRKVLRFLAIDTTHRPRLVTANRAKRVRRPRVAALVRKPPGVISRLVRKLPRWQYRAVNRALEHLWADHAPRPELPFALRASLTAELVPDIELLERLTGRDLSRWKEP